MSRGTALYGRRGLLHEWSSIMLVLLMQPFWGADTLPVGHRNNKVPAACIAAFKPAFGPVADHTTRAEVPTLW